MKPRPTFGEFPEEKLKLDRKKVIHFWAIYRLGISVEIASTCIHERIPDAFSAQGKNYHLNEIH